jgi:hypothetical protein
MAKPGLIIKCPDGVVHNTTIVYRDENGVETPIHWATKLKISMEPNDNVMATMELEVIELEMEIAADCTHVKAHPDFRPSVRQQVHAYCVKKGYTSDTFEEAQAKLVKSPEWVPLDYDGAHAKLAAMPRNPIKDDRTIIARDNPCRCEACRVSQSPLQADECASITDEVQHEDDVKSYRTQDINKYETDLPTLANYEGYFPGFTVTGKPDDSYYNGRSIPPIVNRKLCPGGAQYGEHPFVNATDGGHCATCGYGHK